MFHDLLYMKDVFVLVSDAAYYHKMKRTILDLRSCGQWQGDIVLITLDFELPIIFRDFYRIIEKKFPMIDKTWLLKQIGKGFPDSDGREYKKTNQWEKLHVFDTWFQQWDRVVFLDAGLRVLDSVEHLLALDCQGHFLCPNDAGAGQVKRKEKVFSTQLSFHDPEGIAMLTNEFGSFILDSNYFLNCIWMYDTNILNVVKKEEIIDVMNQYPFCKTNEMAVMNLVLHFRHGLWREFPLQTAHGKILFEWCESNRPGTKWYDYCFLKYPITIRFEDT